jgi:hypothetical protein
MAADVQEDDLLFRYQDGEGDAEAVGKAYRLQTFQLSA